jgi:hypothetical protein
LNESVLYYDAARIERRSGRVKVWVSYTNHYFGRNDSTAHARLEIDCVRRLSHRLEVIEFNYDLGPNASGRTRLRELPSPIEDGTATSALAAQVCPGALI